MREAEAHSNNVNPCGVFFTLFLSSFILRFLPLVIHTQAWSSPREEGLRYKWDEPRDPAASLADPPLGRAYSRSTLRRSTRCETWLS